MKCLNWPVEGNRQMVTAGKHYFIDLADFLGFLADVPERNVQICSKQLLTALAGRI